LPDRRPIPATAADERSLARGESADHVRDAACAVVPNDEEPDALKIGMSVPDELRCQYRAHEERRPGSKIHAELADARRGDSGYAVRPRRAVTLVRRVDEQRVGGERERYAHAAAAVIAARLRQVQIDEQLPRSVQAGSLEPSLMTRQGAMRHHRSGDRPAARLRDGCVRQADDCGHGDRQGPGGAACHRRETTGAYRAVQADRLVLDESLVV
jgi:hypothetical protein